jgi:hypothetical protein
MSDDSFTEVTQISWFQRLKNAIGGIIFGMILFVVAFPVLWWNEGRAVKTAKSLKEGAAAVVSVGYDTVESGNDGKLVHVTGFATTTETITDPQFHISETAIQLRRNVEMYQWVERESTTTEKQTGGSEKSVTTYSYERQWKDSLIDSARFKKPQGHTNPGSMPFTSDRWSARDVTLGAFKLNTNQISRIGNSSKISVGPEHYAALSPELQKRVALQDGSFYIAHTATRNTAANETTEPKSDTDAAEPPGAAASAPIASGSPQIGDVRIAFSVVRPTDVSLIAKQIGNTFEAYQTDAGNKLDMLETGVHSAENMFQAAQARNRNLTWILRGVSFFVMFIGICIFFSPLHVLADVIPIIGNIARTGTALIAFAIAAPLSLLTIGAAWVFYRPVLGVTLFGLALGVFIAAFVLIRGKLAKAKSAS